MRGVITLVWLGYLSQGRADVATTSSGCLCSFRLDAAAAADFPDCQINVMRVTCHPIVAVRTIVTLQI